MPVEKYHYFVPIGSSETQIPAKNYKLQQNSKSPCGTELLITAQQISITDISGFLKFICAG